MHNVDHGAAGPCPKGRTTLGHSSSARRGRGAAAGFTRARDLVDRGVTLALGSDWPVAPSDARQVIADAQLRRMAGRVDDAPVSAAQALTARQALEGLTIAAAASIGDEPRVIAPGRPATLTVFDLDPLATAPDAFADARVLLTTIGGEVVIDAR